ncbi:hypothetical protein J3F83DRAFT_771184 [Trichoderma novae-zelandiae]
MTSATARGVPPSRGGLARLVSRFETLDSSPKRHPGAGEAKKARSRLTLAAKPPDAPWVRGPSLAPVKASPAKRNPLKTPVKGRRIGNAVTPSSTGGRPVSPRGSVVAQRRRLFERGLDENAAPNATQTATYEPKRVASPAIIDDKTPSFASSPAKASSITSGVGDVAKSDLQEGRDIVPVLVTPTSQVEHPELLPPPLASSSRPSSRNQGESTVGAPSKKSTWQRGFEPRIKLQGGIFLHKDASPLKNMVVTDVGNWHPERSDTVPEAVLSGSSSVRTNLQGLASSSLEKEEKEEPEVTLCYPCHDALLSSTASDALQALQERSGPLLPPSPSLPSPQSKVSNLRAKFDGTLPESVSMPSVSKRRPQTDTARNQAPARVEPKTPLRPFSASQISLRPTARRDVPQPSQRGTSPSKDGTLKDKIGLFESMSHQPSSEYDFGRYSKNTLPPRLSRAAITRRMSVDGTQEQTAIRTFDGPPPPMLLAPVENGLRRWHSPLPGVDSVSNQAGDVKPLLYTKPSLPKPGRQRKHLGAMIRSDWRRRTKGSPEDGQGNIPVQLQVYNVDGEGGVSFEQQPCQKIPCEEKWPGEGCDDASSPTKQKPAILSRHPSLGLLRRRLISRSQGLFFVSQAHCTLEQPQPVRGGEIRRLTSLCRERMAAFRARAQTE